MLSSLTSSRRLTITKLPGPESLHALVAPVHFPREYTGAEQPPKSPAPWTSQQHCPLMGQPPLLSGYQSTLFLQTRLLLEPSFVLSNILALSGLALLDRPFLLFLLNFSKAKDVSVLMIPYAPLPEDFFGLSCKIHSSIQ